MKQVFAAFILMIIGIECSRVELPLLKVSQTEFFCFDEEQEFRLTILNRGNRPVKILRSNDRSTELDGSCWVKTELPLEIPAGGTTEVTINFQVGESRAGEFYLKLYTDTKDTPEIRLVIRYDRGLFPPINNGFDSVVLR